MNCLLSCMAYEAAPKCPTASTETLELTEPVRGYDFRVAMRMILYPEGHHLHTPVVIYAGGSAEAFHDSIRKCTELSKMYGVHFVVFDAPGPESHTRSSSVRSRTEAARFAAIEAVHDHVASAGYVNVYVWGRSLGASLAAHLATKHKLRGVILEAPLASLLEFVETAYLKNHPYVRSVVEYYALSSSDAYATARIAQENGFHGVPTHIMHLENDSVLPPAHVELVYQHLIPNNARVYLTEIKGVDHNDEILPEEYGDAVPIELFYPECVPSPDEMSR